MKLHDSHVKQFEHRQILGITQKLGAAGYSFAAAASGGVVLYWMVTRVRNGVPLPRARAKWTWRNHLAYWILKLMGVR